MFAPAAPMAVAGMDGVTVVVCSPGEVVGVTKYIVAMKSEAAPIAPLLSGTRLELEL